MRILPGLLAVWTLLALISACGDSGGKVVPVYDQNTAFMLVGQEIPPGTKDYYLFNLDQGKPAPKAAQEVLASMKQDAGQAQYLGIIGPDPAHSQAVLKAAVGRRNGATFPDLQLIYLGPAQHETTIRKLASPLDANLRYVVYP